MASVSLGASCVVCGQEAWYHAARIRRIPLRVALRLKRARPRPGVDLSPGGSEIPTSAVSRTRQSPAGRPHHRTGRRRPLRQPLLPADAAAALPAVARRLRRHLHPAGARDEPLLRFVGNRTDSRPAFSSIISAPAACCPRAWRSSRPAMALAGLAPVVLGARGRGARRRPRQQRLSPRGLLDLQRLGDAVRGSAGPTASHAICGSLGWAVAPAVVVGLSARLAGARRSSRWAAWASRRPSRSRRRAGRSTTARDPLGPRGLTVGLDREREASHGARPSSSPSPSSPSSRRR